MPESGKGNGEVSPLTPDATPILTGSDSSQPREKRPFWKKRTYWLIAGVVVFALFSLLANIIVEKTQLGHNVNGSGYYLVRRLFDNGKIYIFFPSGCFPVSDASTCPGTFKKKVVYNADAKTFSALDRYYGKDKNSVYWTDEVLDGANPADFKIIWNDNRNDGGYYDLAVSDGKIFLGNTRIDYALRDGTYIIDAKLKGVIPCPNARPYYPANHTGSYYSCDLAETGQDVRVEVDLTTFEALSSLESFSTEIYARDARHVYHVDFDRCAHFDTRPRAMCNYFSVVEGADPVSFRIDKSLQRGYVPTRDARDAYNEYSSGGCKILGIHSTRRLRENLEEGRCYYL